MRDGSSSETVINGKNRLYYSDLIDILRYLSIEIEHKLGFNFYLLLASQAYSPPSLTRDWLMLRCEMTSP